MVELEVLLVELEVLVAQLLQVELEVLRAQVIRVAVLVEVLEVEEAS